MKTKRSKGAPEEAQDALGLITREIGAAVMLLYGDRYGDKPFSEHPEIDLSESSEEDDVTKRFWTAIVLDPESEIIAEANHSTADGALALLHKGLTAQLVARRDELQEQVESMLSWDWAFVCNLRLRGKPNETSPAASDRQPSAAR